MAINPQPQRKRRVWLIVSMIAGVLLFSCIGCAVLGSFLPKTNSAVVHASPTQLPTHVPTHVPTATPTHAAAITSTATTAPVPTATPTQTTSTQQAVLGSDVSAFIAKYGTPNNHTQPPMYHWNHDPSGYVDGLIVTTQQGTQSGKQAISILVAPIGGVIWTKESAKTACMQYVPSDATHVQDVPVPSGPGDDFVYQSATLAPLFTSDNYTDASGNTVQPGTFDILYLYKSDGSVDSCDIQVGEQQTQ